MKKSLLIAVIAAGASGLMMAGPGSDMIIKQRAKDLNNQNNVRQGIAAPAAPAPGTAAARSTAAAAPATPAQTAAARLQADLGALKTGTAATAEQKQKIARDLTASATGGAKPSSGTVTKLANDLAGSAAAVPAPERSRLAQDLTAVLNAGNFQGKQIEAIVADVQAIFQANGVARPAAVAIADDAKAIASEIQKGGAH
jgi:hypothetical protein